MNTPQFFGFGSLVNVTTHDYMEYRPGQLKGWKREWLDTKKRPYCFLSAYPVDGFEIEGLLIKVPNGDWAALDEREASYTRHQVGNVIVPQHVKSEVQIYAIAAENRSPDTRKPILLTYLDVVLLGYHSFFGLSGAQRFVDTTDGWDRPILNDRAKPIYSRAQALSAEEQAWIDDMLACHDIVEEHPNE